MTASPERGPARLTCIGGLALALHVCSLAQTAPPRPQSATADAVVGTNSAGSEAGTTALPAEFFFKRAEMLLPALSPSGRWLALLAPGRSGRLGFQIIDVEGQETPRFLEVSGDADIVSYQWLGDDGLLFTIGDLTGNRRLGGGLQWTNRQGTQSRKLTSNWGLGFGAPGSQEVIVAEPHYDVRGEFSHIEALVVKADTGEWRRVLQDAPRFGEALFDRQGQARLLSHFDDGSVTIWTNERPGGPWRSLGTWKLEDVPFEPQYVDDEGRLVVRTDAGQGGELRLLDPTSGRPADPPLLTTPGFDGDVTPVRERDSGAIVGLRLDVDAQITHWFGDAMRRVQADVDARLPGRVNVLSCRPCDRPGVVLVSSYSDVQPGEFFLYRPAEQRWQFVGAARADIKSGQLATLDFHRIRARDGADLPLWVTLPIAARNKPAPAVVLVHGGPYVRGKVWGWDPDAQFLASRGWVVIEPEFRGSLGYGEAHYRAGWKQWGLTMQDDVSDALKFAIDKGWVDADRVCIVGASYGGYAALMGLVKDPAQYRCGVAFAAVTDIRHRFDMHWSDASTNYRRYGLPMLLGDKNADKVRFVATSPIEQVARIKAPLLLMHGALDRRVPVENGERMRDALRDAGKDFEWVLFPEAGHGFARPEDERAYWVRIERFLRRHLDAPKPAVTPLVVAPGP